MNEKLPWHINLGAVVERIVEVGGNEFPDGLEVTEGTPAELVAVELPGFIIGLIFIIPGTLLALLTACDDILALVVIWNYEKNKIKN